MKNTYKTRRTNGQFQKKGHATTTAILSAGFGLCVVIVALFGSYTLNQMEDWKAANRMNATYMQSTPLAMSSTELAQLQNKTSALR